MKKISKRIIFARIIPLLLILFSIILLIFGKKNILGFAVAKPQATQLSYFVAVVLFIVGLILFLVSESELERYVKSYRRHLEKEEHRKVSYEEAKKEYNKIEDKYRNAIEEGLIRKGYAWKQEGNFIYSGHVSERYITKRGWTEDEIKETIKNPYKIALTRDIKSNKLAIAYYKKGEPNQYIVRDKDGILLQVSDKSSKERGKNWKSYKWRDDFLYLGKEIERMRKETGRHKKK